MQRSIRNLIASALVATWLWPGVARADDLDTLAKAIDAQPESPAAYDAYAMAAFKAQRFDDAIKRLKTGVARIPNYAEGYYKLGYAYRKKSEWADAADYYRRSLQLSPQKTDAYFGLGQALAGLGDKKGAVAAYEKYVALEKAPAKQRFVDQARTEMARLDGKAPAPSPAATAAPLVAQPAPSPTAPMQPAVAPSPSARELAQSHRARADQLRKDGKLADAAQAYHQALEFDRNNLEIYNELGSTYFTLKRFSDAAGAFQEAVGRDASFALGWYNLAHALRKADRRGEAAAAYRKYIALRPDDPDPYYGLAQTLKGLGDVPGAIGAFKKYIEMEKRPDEQRWVEKARTELQALESMPKGPSGKLRELIEPPRVDNRNEAARAGRSADLRNPFGDLWHGDELLDPFESMPDPIDYELAGADGKRKLRAYATALAAYRRALSKHVEEIEARYEKGSQLAWNGAEPRAAMRAWNGIALSDPEVDAARKNLERVRAQLTR